MERERGTTMMKRSKLRTSAVLAALAGCVSMACSKKPEEPTGAKTDTAALATPQVVVSPEACKACLANTQCPELPACSSLQGDDQAACDAVEKCVQTSNCADGKETFTSCFCGSLKMSDCVAAPKSGQGAPAGKCADVMRKSFGSDDPSNREILARFTKPRYPGGAAIARMNCTKYKGCGPACGF